MGGTVFDLEEAELCYAPQYGSAKDAVNIAGKAGAVALELVSSRHGSCHLCITLLSAARGSPAPIPPPPDTSIAALAALHCCGVALRPPAAAPSAGVVPIAEVSSCRRAGLPCPCAAGMVASNVLRGDTRCVTWVRLPLPASRPQLHPGRRGACCRPRRLCSLPVVSITSSTCTSSLQRLAHVGCPTGSAWP